MLCDGAELVWALAVVAVSAQAAAPTMRVDANRRCRWLYDFTDFP